MTTFVWILGGFCFRTFSLYRGLIQVDYKSGWVRQHNIVLTVDCGLGGNCVMATDNRTGKMQKWGSHVNDTSSFLAMPRPPRLQNKWEELLSNLMALSYNQRLTDFTRELTVWARYHVLGLGSQVWAPGHPSPGRPYSVGSKGGFFQARIGPVDGHSLSGLTEPSRIFWNIPLPSLSHPCPRCPGRYL